MASVKGISKSVTQGSGVERMGLPATDSINPDLKKIMDEDCKLVEGRFKNYETPGGRLPFTAGKYPGQPLFTQVFEDGETYKVPLWVARWLNGIDATAKALNGRVGSCSYPVHGYKWDPGKPAPASAEGGGGIPVPAIGVSKRVQRYGFESLEFNPGI